MTTDVEVWRAVPGFEGLYEVSDQGRVRSLSRHYQKRNRWGQVARVFTQGRILKLGPHPGGYLLVHLYRDGKRTAMTLHKVVLLAFVGLRPKGMEALHANGDPTDCRLANLSYGTKKENESDKVRHGTRQFGEESHRSKLSAADVRHVRKMTGASQEFLAEMFGCSPSNISAIQLRKSWRHLR